MRELSSAAKPVSAPPSFSVPNSRVHALLYHNPKSNRGKKITLLQREAFEKASPDILVELISFVQSHVGDSGSWLEDYLSHWVGQHAIHCLRNEGRLVATGELRPSPSQLGIAELGVIVHRDYREKRTATRAVDALIHDEQQNLAAQKALTRAGLAPHHRMPEVSW